MYTAPTSKVYIVVIVEQGVYRAALAEHPADGGASGELRAGFTLLAVPLAKI
jgi:hypothetical protein